MERFSPLRGMIEKLESEGDQLRPALLREVYLNENYRAGYFWGETDVPRIPKAVRMYYFDNPREFKVVTIHLSGQSDVEQNRKAMREILGRIPGDPAFLQLLLSDAVEIIAKEKLRVLSALEIADAADNNRRIVSIYYPKILSRLFGDEISTLVAASAQQAILVPDSKPFDTDLPTN